MAELFNYDNIYRIYMHYKKINPVFYLIVLLCLSSQQKQKNGVPGK
ncbi:MAG: hypothetical protein JWR38_4091 [Mucilaginibacter sp.]|nr:hypothetical protein [Mucilaginibacter sp.]